LRISQREALHARFTLLENGYKPHTSDVRQDIPLHYFITADPLQVSPPTWQYRNMQILDNSGLEVQARTPRVLPAPGNIWSKNSLLRAITVTVRRTA
jgi:hypothetical protein